MVEPASDEMIAHYPSVRIDFLISSADEGVKGRAWIPRDLLHQTKPHRSYTWSQEKCIRFSSQRFLNDQGLQLLFQLLRRLLVAIPRLDRALKIGIVSVVLFKNAVRPEHVVSCN